MNCLSCIVIGAASTPVAQKELIDSFATHNGIDIKTCIVAADGCVVESIRSLRDASPSDGAWHDPVVTAHLPSVIHVMVERIPVLYCGSERVAPAVPVEPRDDTTTRIMADTRSAERGAMAEIRRYVDMGYSYRDAIILESIVRRIRNGDPSLHSADDITEILRNRPHRIVAVDPAVTVEPKSAEGGVSVISLVGHGSPSRPKLTSVRNGVSREMPGKIELWMHPKSADLDMDLLRYAMMPAVALTEAETKEPKVKEPKAAEKNGVSKDDPTVPIPPSRITFAKPEKRFPHFLSNGDLALSRGSVYTVETARRHAAVAKECVKLEQKNCLIIEMQAIISAKFGPGYKRSTIGKILTAHKMGMFDRL